MPGEFNPTLQYERLRRHFLRSSERYEEVELVDLAHSLRVWADMKDQMALLAQGLGHAVKLPHTPYPKALKRFIGRLGFVFIPFPGGLVAGGASVHTVVQVGTLLSEEKAQQVVDISANLPIRHLGLCEWFGAFAVKARVQDPKGRPVSLDVSRETLIKRVANLFGGSHPGIPEKDPKVENQFDGPTRLLMTFRIANVPAPYFMLLKMANDLIEGFKAVFADGETEADAAPGQGPAG